MTERRHKYGCPCCGKPTAGMPTDQGFIWATCETCLERRSTSEGRELADTNTDGNGTED